MANKEHLAKLQEGVKAWNVWREQNPDIWPDLWGADLFLENLSEADFVGVDLGETHLRRAYLCGAELSKSDLGKADLAEANLREVDLSKANLAKAFLVGVDLSAANISEAKLCGADLTGANLSGADLRRANLAHAVLRDTIFANVDLTNVKGLDACNHHGPSTIDHRTLEQSSKLPLAFLQGCGLSDWEIEAAKLYQPELTHGQITDIVYRIDAIRAESPIQIHKLFISYAHTDNSFVEHLEGHLRKRHVRFWRDVHDAPAGPLEKIVVRAMRHNPTVLLILSARSVESDWVEFEAEQARKLEKELKRHVLCPVTLDDSWKTCKWNGMLRNQIKKYNVLDFSHWRDANVFEGMFKRLLKGLDLFYEKDQVG